MGNSLICLLGGKQVEAASLSLFSWARSADNLKIKAQKFTFLLLYLCDWVALCFRSSFHTSVHTRAHGLLWPVVLWVRPRSLPGVAEVLVASTPPEQRVSHHYQHHGLGQRSAQATRRDSRERKGKKCLNRCLSPAVRRIWISAPGGHDPLLSSDTCHPAGSQWCHPMPRPHPRVSADSPGVSDAPTCSDSSGWVYREPHPPQKLHSSYRTVNIPGSGTTRNRVSIPRSACVVFNSQYWSWLHHLWAHRVCRKHQRSNEHRELTLLAYLSQLQSPDSGPVRPLNSLTPYQV